MFTLNVILALGKWTNSSRAVSSS